MTSLTTGKSRTRSIISTVLLVITLVLIPVSVTASSLGTTLSNTDRFVETFAPVVQNPEVQETISTTVGDAIATQLVENDPTVAIEQYVAEAGAPRLLVQGVGMLASFAMQSIELEARGAVDSFVASDRFATLWEGALRAVHRSMIIALTGDEGEIFLRLDSDGTLWLQADALADVVRSEIASRSTFVASLIPQATLDDVRLAQEPAFAQARQIVGAIDAIIAIPWVVLALCAVGGITLSTQRRRDVLRATLIACAIHVALALAITYWPLPNTGVGTQLVSAIAAPLREQTTTSLLLSALVLAAIYAAVRMAPALRDSIAQRTSVKQQRA